MMIQKSFITSVFMLSSLSVYAVPIEADLETCTYSNGRAIDPDVCSHMKKKKARQDEARANVDSGVNLDNCTYGTGAPIEATQCNIMKRLQEKEDERVKKAEDSRQRYSDYLESVRKRDEQIAELKAKQEREQQEYNAKYLAEQAAKKAADDKQRAEWDRIDREAQKKKDAKIAEIKAHCGDDYKSPKIGMTLERVKKCVAPVKLVSQLNRADGVVSTYEYGSMVIHVMSGRVVAWDK